MFHPFIFSSRRSNIVARNGMVATSQPLAAQIGLDVLKSGGNAVDSAIATAAALCVLEPCSTGIGGDAFGLIWSAAEKRLYGVNASGPAPAGLSADILREMGYRSMPERGPLTITVPGSLRGWQLALERFGSMGLDSLLSPSIDYARNGFAVSELIAGQWQASEELLSKDPDSQRCWMPDSRSPRPNEIFWNPEFAITLETLANQGYDAFYKGEIGRQIVTSIQDAGGVLNEDDLATFRAEWVEPISLPYRNGFTFYEIPPNGQGLTALIALNLVKEFGIRATGYGTVDFWHILIEAIKLAFADAEAFIADPLQVEVPVRALLSEPYARRRRSLIDPMEAKAPGAGDPATLGDTVYLSVADGDGNMVSWIQSLYSGFGSGLTAGRSGILLQNRGANFVLEPGHPNELQPGKRPYHTIIPGFITRDGRPWAPFGVMGGFMQPQGHLLVGINLVEFAMAPQAALDAPRFRWLGGKRLALEPAVPEEVRQELIRRGHQLLGSEETSQVFFGGGQVIIRDLENGVLIGGSDPRRDGAAVGW